jgi:hypothetical protein
MSVWAVGFFVWLALLIVTFRLCSGWRSRGWAYGLAPIGLLLWIAPNAAFGSTGAKAVGQIIAVSGFWIAAVYLAVLLIAEFTQVKREKADG